ncbi:MAG: hypothetical protein EPN93_21525 [Spirochaetes bacterium]|nr:MAG: hypothetical protein EPN93_21525 [Spirochaetota bacterium]
MKNSTIIRLSVFVLIIFSTALNCSRAGNSSIVHINTGSNKQASCTPGNLIFDRFLALFESMAEAQTTGEGGEPPTGITSYDLKVSGPGMGTMNEVYPGDTETITLEVPAGSTRLFELTAKRAEGNYRGSAKCDLRAGEEVTVSITMKSVGLGYTVTYYGNNNTGGEVPIDANAYNNGDTVTVLGYSGNLVIPGITFIGWDTQADGKGTTYIPGQTFTMGSADVSLYAKWFTWSVFGSANNTVKALAVDGSCNLYVGGYFTIAGGSTLNYIAKWDGTSWSALGTGMGAAVYALEVDGSGNLYAGGSFTTAGGATANRIAKWDGSSWSALGTGMGAAVYALAVDGSDNLYAGGSFTTAGGSTASCIAKWDGSSWSALGSGISNASGPANVFALAVDGSGNLYAGGSFPTAGGTTANHIAKWNGSTWSALGSGMDDEVYALAADSSGNLYAGGYFISAGGTAASCIAKWDGSSWSALGSGMYGTNDYWVNALAVDGSGNLYAGGSFTTAGGTAANGIAKWDGSSWTALGSDLNSEGEVCALTVDGYGNLFAGGAFSVTVGGGGNASNIAEFGTRVTSY